MKPGPFFLKKKKDYPLERLRTGAFQTPFHEKNTGFAAASKPLIEERNPLYARPIM